MYGDGSTRRDYTYIDDIIDGMLGALRYVESHEQVYEIVNLGTNHTIALTELVQTIEQELGRKASIRRLPGQPGDVEKTYADITKAGRLFGYDPKTQLAQGIHRFVTWYRSECIW
ncbi:dTDP-4-dehydro-6-deoxyglucose reductase [compost metagenome]